MKIKWYWLAEQLGLVKDMTDLTSDYGTTYEVSAKTDEIFHVLYIALVLGMFVFALVVRLIGKKFNKNRIANVLIYGFLGFFTIYTISSMIGFGPYITWYPRSGGFISISPPPLIGHILSGIPSGIVALSLYFGNRLGKRKDKK